MKRFIALTVVLMAVAGLTICFAGTERYSSKEVAPVVQPECDWTGFYIGVHGGWRGGDANWYDPTDTADGGLQVIESEDNTSEFFGGIQVGYNWQMNSWFVIGVELTGSYGGGFDPTKSYVVPGDEVLNYKTESDWSGTFALRLGFTSMNNKLLVYVKGGGAVTHWNYDYVNNETMSAGGPEFDRWSQEETQVSPMVGVGAEYMFNCHWSLKIEYQRIFLRDKTITGLLVEDPSFLTKFTETNELQTRRIDRDQDSVQVGINYKF
jgi:outer membrane immunogenic protein